MMPSTTSPDRVPGTRRDLQIGDTTLAVHERGAGPAVLLIHGGGEDASMLAGQAESLAVAGFDVIAYDRRGTGESGRENWPGSGARQHANDAVALLAALDVEQATVVGLSSGGVVALALAAHYPGRVARVIAWEPPAVGVLPDGEAVSAQMMAPVEAYLVDHPGDFVGAQAILLSAVVGFPVTVDDPAFEAARANAEAMIRDEPAITLERFTPDAFVDTNVTIALGRAPLEVITAAAEQITTWTGTAPRRVAADHEVYLSEPAVLTDFVVRLGGVA